MLDLELRPRGATVYFALTLERRDRGGRRQLRGVREARRRPASATPPFWRRRSSRRASARPSRSARRSASRAPDVSRSGPCRSALATACMRLTALSFCVGVGEILVGGVHRQLQQLRDLLAGLAVGGQPQAFELALRDRRHLAAVARPHARRPRQTARSSGHGFRRALSCGERDLRRRGRRPARTGRDRHGRERRCRWCRRRAATVLPPSASRCEGRANAPSRCRRSTSRAPSRRGRGCTHRPGHCAPAISLVSRRLPG